MKKYKLTDEEYKLLMTIGEKSKCSYDNKFYVSEQDGAKYFTLDAFILNGLYNNVQKASEKIAREFKEEGEELFHKMCKEYDRG